MPEYLAPGVFVEETSFRPKTIEGVGTSTTGFIGPCRQGPIKGKPELLTSFSDFERIYGGIDQLEFEDVNRRTNNYLAHAVRTYFEEGGKQLYVARIFHQGSTDGIARWESAETPVSYRFQARYPGMAGNFTVTLVFKLGDNTRHEEPIDPSAPDGDSCEVLRGAGQFDVVLAGNRDTSTGDAQWYWVEQFIDEDLNRYSHRLRRTDTTVTHNEVTVALADVDTVRRLTVSVLVGSMGRFGNDQSWEDLSLHPGHSTLVSSVFNDDPPNRSTELLVPMVFTNETLPDNGAAIAVALMTNPNLAGTGNIIDHIALDANQPKEATRSFSISLENGADGDLPEAVDYEGNKGAMDGRKSGLRAFEDLEDISILAAPGSSFNYFAFTNDNSHIQADAITRRLISHCERKRYRVAVLDSVNGHTQGEVRDYRSGYDTTRAAFYYPWVRILDPFTGDYIYVPPSGSVTGIYARNDINRGVHKAPANEVLRMADGLEFDLNNAQQEVLNPLGINCLRFFEGRGFRIWGARTATSNPEWKYLNVRRYFDFLERSIELGTQWAVFENNGERLWANVRTTIEDFLFNEWRQNHLLGDSPNEAYFVRCDRSTMTQNDLDNGRMLCLIGAAPLRPAEFVIFRVGQKTVDAR